MMTSLGASLLVPCVQELAKERMATVPVRYVRSDQDPPMTISADQADHASSLPQVPVINMQNFDLSNVNGDYSKNLELQKLHCACREWGFFQLINHGVSPSLMEKVKLEIEGFFKLPMEEKKKYWQEPGDIEGYGQVFVLSEEQKLDWADMFYMVTLPTCLRKPHLFPKLPPSFRDTLESYSMEVKKLAVEMLELMAVALKMEVKDMKELFEEGMQAMRFNYYPPCPEPELVIGLTPHSDAAGLTIVLQVNEMPGLQIKHDGKWIPVTPLPNAFIVNVGDILEVVTNGIYRSIEHRAVVNSEKERLSVAAFLTPKLDGDLGPAPSLVNPQTPALFRRVNAVDYLKGLFARELKGRSYLDCMRIHND